MNEAASLRDWWPLINSAVLVGLVVLYLLDRRAMRQAIGAIPAFTESLRIMEERERLENKVDEEIRQLRLQGEATRAEVVRHVDSLREDLVKAEGLRLKQTHDYLVSDEQRMEQNRKILNLAERSGRKVDWLIRVMEQRPCVLAGACEHDSQPLPPPPRFEDLVEPEDDRLEGEQG